MSVQRQLPKHPKDLAEFRVWLWKQWQPGEFFWNVAQMTRRERRLPGADWIPLEAMFDDMALAEANLYWVSAEMCELIDTASKTLLPTTLTTDLVPAPAGFVFFEKPLRGMPAQTEIDLGTGPHQAPEDIMVRALLWGTSMIPPGPHKAIGIASYAQLDIFAPAGRTDWEWGVDTEQPIDEVIKDDQQRLDSMAEDRRWMATFWLLLSQTGIADTRIERPMPKTVRYGKRVIPSLSSPQFDVRVVDVHRRARAAASHSTGTGREIDWQYRVIVEPHWKQQAYGPRHSLRRPIWIDPYIRGPEDKPLKIKPTVHVLKDGEL